MSTTNLQFILTQAGQDASFNNGALDLAITHVQIGSGNRTPNGTETALVTPREYTTIAAATEISAGQWRLSAIIAGSALNYNVSEIGLWNGIPGGALSTLIFYWSQATGNTGVKTPAVDFNVETDMAFGGIVPANITIVADTEFNALSMIAQHNADTNAHPWIKLGFVASLVSQNGYIKFPDWLGGLIIQWGISPIIAANTAHDITYPIAFTTINMVSFLTFIDTASFRNAIQGGQLRGVPADLTTLKMGNISSTNNQFNWISFGK